MTWRGVAETKVVPLATLSPKLTSASCNLHLKSPQTNCLYASGKPCLFSSWPDQVLVVYKMQIGFDLETRAFQSSPTFSPSVTSSLSLAVVSQSTLERLHNGSAAVWLLCVKIVFLNYYFLILRCLLKLGHMCVSFTWMNLTTHLITVKDSQSRKEYWSEVFFIPQASHLAKC